MSYTIVDFEATRVSKRGNKFAEVIEIGAVRIEEDGTQKELHFFVKPRCSKVSYSELSFIPEYDFDNAIDFDEAYSKFIEFTRDSQVYSWGKNDIKFLNMSYSLNKDKVGDMPKIKSFIDLQVQFKKISKTARLFSVKDACIFIGEVFCGNQHSAIDDARNTAKIFNKIMQKRP